MNILSIWNGKNASVSYANGSDVLYSCAEERLVRKKLFRGYPSTSINHILDHFNLSNDEVDLVVCGGWFRPDYQVIFDLFSSIDPCNPTTPATRIYNSLDIDSRYRQDLLVNAARQFPNARI